MNAMSRSELERLVSSAETDPVLQRVLQRCRSCRQLIEAARRHGYRVTHSDVQRAWLEERQQQQQQQASADGTPAGAAGA